jgi:hypothetical protein
MGNGHLPLGWTGHAAVALLTLAAVGCRSVDPVLKDERGALISELAPAPYYVAVDRVRVSDAVLAQQDAKLFLSTVNGEHLRDLLAEALAEQNAASEVVPYRGDAAEESIDLVIVPRLEDVGFSYSRASSKAPLAVLVWFGTWIGGLWVEDSRYDCRVRMSFDVVDRQYGANLAEGRSVESAGTGLTFWDRNGAASVGFLEALVIPPIWTHDDRDVTSQTLTRRAMVQLAAQLKGYLSDRLDPDERYARIDIESPTNGATVAGSNVSLEGQISSPNRISRILLYVNGVEVDQDPELDAAPPNADGRVLTDFVVECTELLETTNLVRLVVDDWQGQYTTRTLVLRRE